MTLTITPDRKCVERDTSSRRLLKVVVQAPKADTDTPRPPVSVAFVLDRSGSMAGTKLKLAKRAIERSLERLTPADRFAVVVYDHEYEVVAPLATATHDARRTALAQLDTIGARGSTDIGAGWLAGCAQIADGLGAETLARCLVLTDGLANQGMTDSNELAHHAQQLRRRRVSTSTFGVGADFNEGLLGAMADSGGGSFYFIDEPSRIPALISQELGDALEVVCRDVVLRVRAPGGARVSVIGPYEARRGDHCADILLPDLVSDQVLELGVALELPKGELPAVLPVVLELIDSGNVLGGATAQTRFERADAETNRRQPRDVEVQRFAARLYAARAREKAAIMNRDHAYQGAADRLRAMAARIRGFADGDVVMSRIATDLDRDAESYAAPMSEVARKTAHYKSYTTTRSLTICGTKTRWR